MIYHHAASNSWRLVIGSHVSWHHSYASAYRWQEKYWLAVMYSVAFDPVELGEDSSRLE